MRSKTSYAMDEVMEDGRKRTKVVKQRMAPIQRDGFEYEFDVFIDMDLDNNAIVTKTRCPALTGKVFPRPGADVAEILATWLKGQPAPEPPPTDPSGQGHDPAGGSNGAGSGNGTGGGGGNGADPVDPQMQAGRRLRAKLEAMGVSFADPSATVTAALAGIDQPWARQAVGLGNRDDLSYPHRDMLGVENFSRLAPILDMIEIAAGRRDQQDAADDAEALTEKLIAVGQVLERHRESKVKAVQPLIEGIDAVLDGQEGDDGSLP